MKVGEFKERLKDILGDQSVRAFARACGLSEGVLRQYLSGQSEPTRLALLAIATAGGVLVGWLVSGLGPKWAEGSRPEPEEEDPEYINIPFLEQAGSSADAPGHKPATARQLRPFPSDEIRRYGADPDNLKLAKVQGESMLPTLLPGDDVLVDMTGNQSIVDGIYAVQVDDTLMVKRIQHLPGQKLVVQSDNPVYQSFETKLADSSNFFILGRVIWAGRRF